MLMLKWMNYRMGRDDEGDHSHDGHRPGPMKRDP